MNKHFVILSEGAYSDYSPIYFMSDKGITQEELDKKGVEFGDELIGMAVKLPSRPHTPCFGGCGDWCQREDEKYWEDGKTFYSHQLAEMWFKKMREWIVGIGFEELPEEIPEINVSYSDIPHS